MSAAAVATYHCEHAWLGGGAASRDVAVSIEPAAGRIVAVERRPPRPGDVRLAGLTLPGFANAHSHAFHRLLRGRSQHGRGSFWTWREQMYAAASRLDPDSYRRLATAAYAEMVLAGYTSVGEFHYLHHQGGGRPYADPNAMAVALVEAAALAGCRITVLDTCYLEGAPGVALEGPQLRFGDRTAAEWAERTAGLGERLAAAGASASSGAAPASSGAAPAPAAAPVRLAQAGCAVHSVRAVPPPAIEVVAAAAAERGQPLHVHLSEQPAENAAIHAAYGVTPTSVLEHAGALGPGTTAVHATHLGSGDHDRLARAGTAICMCPTTERDLGDGIGPARQLADGGCPIVLGSDSQAVVDAFEELRALELDERLASGERGRFTTEELLGAATSAGHAALGWPDAGRIAPGQLADLVTVGLSSVRLAGAGTDPAHLLEHVVFAGSAADVTDVIVSGRHVVRSGAHRLGDIARQLDDVIGELVGRH